MYAIQSSHVMADTGNLLAESIIMKPFVKKIRRKTMNVTHNVGIGNRSCWNTLSALQALGAACLGLSGAGLGLSGAGLGLLRAGLGLLRAG